MVNERPSQGHRDLEDGGLELWAPTEEALFDEAARAVTARTVRGLPAAAADRSALRGNGQPGDRLRRWIEAVIAAGGGERPEIGDVEVALHAHGVWARIGLAGAPGPLLRLPQPYVELEHTADLGVQVRGATAEETLARLVCVFGRLLAGDDDVAVGPAVRIEAPGGDLPLAAADILRDLLYRFATERMVPSACRTLHLHPQVAVEVALGTWDPERGGADIKAITLHQLRFEPDGDGWLAQVVFDV